VSAAEPAGLSGRRAFRGLRLLIVLLALAGALVYVLNPLHVATSDLRLRLFGLASYRSPSVGMEPTIAYQEVFTASAWPYRSADPKPGDIVVFASPRDRALTLVKRVIAAGGSTVEIVGGVTRVDGRELAQPWLAGVLARGERVPDLAPVRVPPGSYFVMGDNAARSDDSRDFGPVPRALILAKVERR
jgi:signal peptidase I